MKRTLISLMIFTFCLPFAAAEEEALRPVPSVSGETGLFDVYEAHTLKFKQLSVQLSWENWERDPGNLDVSEEALSFCYGLTDKLEVSLSIRARQVKADPDPEDMGAYYMGHIIDGYSYHTGTGDPHFGMKYNFLPEKSGRPGLAILGYTDLPRSDEDSLLGAGKTDYGVKFIATKRLGSMVLSGNIGYEKLNKTDLPVSVDQPDLGLYGVGLRFPIDKRFQGIAEITGYWFIDDDDDLVHDEHTDLVLGAQYGFLNGWGLAGGVRYTPNMDSDDGYGGVVKISYTSPGEKMKEESLEVASGMGPEIARPEAKPVAVNLPPTLKVSSDSTIVEEGTAVRIRALATDPDGDLLTYEWETDKGRIIGSGPEVMWQPEPGQTGPARIVSRVSDGKGGTTTDSVDLKVIDKQVPIREFEPVYFEFDKYSLDARARDTIVKVCKYLKDYPELRVRIEGHCCSIATDEYNLALGQHRANAIEDYMILNCNLDPERITTVSYGESRPAHSNETEAGRKLNRRGEFKIIIEE